MKVGAIRAHAPAGYLRATASALLLAAGLPFAAVANQPDTALIARGKYLATVGDCSACHTKDGGAPFAGGKLMNTPFGALPSSNITPDMETGIGKWTDDQFYRALHDGKDDEGHYIYPAMPYPWYTRVTREDVLAIKAYLFSLPPVHAPNLPNQMSFPFNIRLGLAAWQEAFFKPGTFQPDPAQSDEVNRGAYLVEGLAHCGECHNAHPTLGASNDARPLQGGELQDWYAPNITSDVRQGIGKYSNDQLVTYLKTGTAQGIGVANGPMAETIHGSLSKLTDEDLKAMVAYLKATPAAASYEAKKYGVFKGPIPEGREVYLNHCASCHQLDGKGIPNAVASLAGNGSVLAGGPQDVIHVILGGIEAHGSDAPMPAVGTGMSDQSIAGVTNYVRQAFGNAAPPTAAAGMVGELRKSTRTTMNLGVSCPDVNQPQIAAAVADPATGIAGTLKSIDQINSLQTVDAIVMQLKQIAPRAQQADIVNGLSEAYCPVIVGKAGLSYVQKVSRFNNFSERVYGALTSNRKD